MSVLEENAVPDSDADVAGVRSRADRLRQVKVVAVFALAALLLLFFALDIDDPMVRLLRGERVTAEDPGLLFDGRRVVWICFALCLVALVPAALNRLRGGVLITVAVVVGTAFLAGFVIWNYADQAGTLAIANPLQGTIKYSVPLVFGALAGCVCERAGVINIAIEGQFIFGAFAASILASLAYNAELGLVGGILGGVCVALLLGVFALRYQVNQVVLGVVLIALATGLTDFLFSQFPDDADSRKYVSAKIGLEPVPDAGYPVLSPIASSLGDLPGVLGELFRIVLDQTLLAYLMYIAVVWVAFVLFQTRWGLRVRAVGEHPKAADTVGVKVNRTRMSAVLLGGALAGLGGAFFTVGRDATYQVDLTAGNGFIALAAVIMGRWHPVYATFAALFFGLMTQLKAQLDAVDKIPGELITAMPYLATIIAVAGLVGAVRPPAADGEPYVKG